MSVFASEILDLRSSPEYLAMGYFGRLGAENKIQVKLCKRTGASDVKFDLGYARAGDVIGGWPLGVMRLARNAAASRAPGHCTVATLGQRPSSGMENPWARI